MRRHHGDGRAWLDFAHLGDEVEAAEPGHLDIGENDVRAEVENRLPRQQRIGERPNLEPPPREHGANVHQHVQVVFHHDRAVRGCRHWSPLEGRSHTLNADPCSPGI